MIDSRSGRFLRRVPTWLAVAVIVLVWPVAGTGCQHQRVEVPSDRLSYLGPFAVHLAYTDGQNILGRSAPTVVELAEAPTVTLLVPDEPVDGLSMTFFRNRRWIAWRDGDGNLHAGVVPGAMQDTVLVDSIIVATRPGITATEDRLYISTSRGASIFVYWSADGQVWERRRVVDMPFAVGATDLVHVDGNLWIAATTRDRSGTDSAVLLRVGINALGIPATGPIFYPTTTLPPAIDGSRRVRIASDGSLLAVSCVSQPIDFTTVGINDLREGYIAVSDPAEGFQLTWSGGSGRAGRGDMMCPPALVFVSVSQTGSQSPVQRLGRVSPSGGGAQQNFVASLGGPFGHGGQVTGFEQFTPVLIRDAALAYGQERVSLKDVLRRGGLDSPPN